MRRYFFLGVLVAIAAALLLPAPAGAGNNHINPDALPRLTVRKIVENGPGTGKFVVQVKCEREEKERAVEVQDQHGDGPFVTTLVFNPDGSPKSADQNGWVSNSAWSFQGWELAGRRCTVVEIERDGAIDTHYKCEFSSTPVAKDDFLDPVDAANANGLVPGCAEPESQVQAVVQYGFPWWPRECLPDDNHSEPRADIIIERPLCHEDATVTVKNTLPKPPRPEPPVPAALAVVVQPTFTG